MLISILVRSMVRVQSLAMLFPLLTILGCQTPSTIIDAQARHTGLQRSIVRGTNFLHLTYQSQGTSATGPVHIYLEGDGLPWTDETRISSDPTPRRAYALELMALDSGSTLYLGRPCYHAIQPSDPCSPEIWTDKRYSEAVVDSLEAAIRSVTDEPTIDELILIGYSGGGVLAMLLAERLENTQAVVTVASNLDIDAWAETHGYTPLTGSLNPAKRPPLPATIRQLHLVGGLDDRVPAKIVEPVARRQLNSEYLVYPKFDHNCCWTEIWQDVLSRLADPAD